MPSEQMVVECTCTPVFEDEWGPENGMSPSTVIINGLADAEGVAPTDLQPLYEMIEPTLLDDLLLHIGAADTPGSVFSFAVDKWNIFVREDGKVRVCDTEQPAQSAPTFTREVV